MAPKTRIKPPKNGPSTPSSSVSLKKVKGENFYRDAKAVARRNMLSGGKPVRDKDGKIIQAAAFQKGEDETKPGRVQPDKRWFGNTRVISQTALDHFRTSLQTRKDDPYSVILRRNKLPMQLLDDSANPNIRKRPHIVEVEPFSETFGPKAQRKRPRIEASSFEELGKLGSAIENDLESKAEVVGSASTEMQIHTHIDPIYSKGTSRRIYGELYKVIDSSDVLLHILDARDPLGTMCNSVLDYIKKEKAHKQVVLIINKCDLVPNWVTARYIQHLTPRFPVVAFHASPHHSFGKGALIQLLRQFSRLHSDKKQISVGFIGYPNVGKSSIINTLKSGKVCRVAPIPGETKVWQYITLTRRIYLIDCPGIVPASAHDSQASIVLKGVLRVEALPTPAEYIPILMERVKPVYLSRTYDVPLPDKGDPSIGWTAEEFLDKLARMKGRLLKGGEPDVESVAKIILNDWVRGRIPFFVAPPERSEELNKTEAKKLKQKEKLEQGRINVDEERHIVVKQNIGSIMQRNMFVKEDVRAVEWEDGGGDDLGKDENSEERRNGKESTSNGDVQDLRKDEDEDKDVGGSDEESSEEDIEEAREEGMEGYEEEDDDKEGDEGGGGEWETDEESCESEGDFALGVVRGGNRPHRMPRT